MNNLIRDKNNELVKNDIIEIYSFLKFVIKNKDPVLHLGSFYYCVFIIIEVINYLENVYKLELKKNLKYKKALINIRSRLKPYENLLENNKLYSDIENLNEKTMNSFFIKAGKLAQIFFKSLITNLGVYKYTNNIIGNTFLYEKKYKTIMKDSNKVYEVSQVIGESIVTIARIFKININDYMIKNFKIVTENSDYNVYENKNKLFNNSNTNINLLLLDEMSIINFYRFIITKIMNNNETKYRLGYIVFFQTIKNIETIIQLNNRVSMENDLSKLSKEIDVYKDLVNDRYRNCMYHYDICNDLNKEDIIHDEMFFGLIKKHLNINETEFKDRINMYIENVSNLIEGIILI